MPNDFIEFLKKNKVFTIAIATLLSGSISDIIESFIENIILPFVNTGVFDTDIDNNNIADQIQLRELTIKVLNTNIKVGKVIISIIKFIILSYLIYLIVVMSKNII
jgi:large conductance mechanosensitive channel